MRNYDFFYVFEFIITVREMEGREGEKEVKKKKIGREQNKKEVEKSSYVSIGSLRGSMSRRQALAVQ